MIKIQSAQPVDIEVAPDGVISINGIPTFRYIGGNTGHLLDPDGKSVVAVPCGVEIALLHGLTLKEVASSS